MTTLKEETIKGILTEDAFDMSDFGDETQLKQRNRRKKKFCGTSCCIAGHIVAAAARLGRKIPTAKQMEQADRHFYESGEYQYPAPFINTAEGTEDNVAMAARVLWARSYGKQSAADLDFYARGPEMHEYGHEDLEAVPADAAVAHLERVTKKTV